MPYINTTTNVKISDEKREVLKFEFGNAIAMLGKTESWLMLNFEDEKEMYFKGNNSSPMAFVDISVFGHSADEQCENMTKEICKILNENLDIAPDKIYVKFTGTNQWGWNNMVF